MLTQEAMTTILFDVGKEVVENLTFLFITSVETDSPEGSEVIEASVKFNGFFEGAFSVRANDAIVQELTNNMLGKDDSCPSSENERRDAFGELCNIICGNVLAEIAGADPVFNLMAPEISRKTNTNDFQESKQSASAELFLDKGLLTLRLNLYQ